MRNIRSVKTKVGYVILEEEDGFIVEANMRDEPKPDAGELTDVLKSAKTQVVDYFDGKLFEFSLPLKPEGTDFQKRVWEQLCKIPYGETISYMTLAERAGSPKGYRAAGNANGKNPISIFIP